MEVGSEVPGLGFTQSRQADPAILAVGLTDEDLGPILAGSPMKEYQDELLVSDAAQDVQDCLGS